MADKQTPGLLELDTVSFDAELPFLAQALEGDYSPRLQRETRLALRVLAAPGETPDDSNPILLRLEAKLDLALEVSLLERHPERPPCTPCRLGLNAIAWQDSQAWAPGQPLLLSLYPNPDSALSLCLYGRVLECRPQGGKAHLLSADIHGSFDQDTHLMWEKWVFRRHRRAILER
ncbi:hypothetical protein VL04_19935 [Chromobacterium violaceum]|uniref:hypothetical protein n=1 Tax=Chromobacterium violaceum TaxID=536 RepID=UPI0006542116|nr:hypothetical protein [Chromobacterium violaceum]KMN47327.1 hypothetical protein VK93_21140 [Chromobacterium violaceum]KMN84418.1 hypothetical protein VL02_19690 [Chromobacterium violaceum]KMN88588.1 hypothetical protein VL04_19935 [Chromobacterium violaceum]KMO02403.1 hypothetical protein VL16_18700 [Chromobacterium violaceum]